MLEVFFRSHKKGFTLIELLVVISVIGLLASITVVALGGARRGGRDVRAKADLRQIQTALELCYDKSSPPGYPDFTGSAAATPWVNVSGGPTSITCPPSGGTTFLSPVPTTNGAVQYQWNDFDSPTKYGLRADLEETGCFTITEVGVTETATGGC
jgi:prepilin-type N-terminal cleavage/methylation domain-containing protein